MQRRQETPSELKLVPWGCSFAALRNSAALVLSRDAKVRQNLSATGTAVRELGELDSRC